MRTNIVMLAVLAGFGLSGAAPAEAKNLSCISGISPGEQRLLRDCEPKPVEEEEVVYVLVVDPPSPPPEPARMKHGESKGDFGRDKPGGGNSGGGNPGGGNSGGSSSGGGNAGDPHGAAN